MKRPTLFKINIIKDLKKKKNSPMGDKVTFQETLCNFKHFLSPPSFNLAINFKDTYANKILDEIQKFAMNDLLYK